jgi:hypothetical protein
LNAGEEVFDFRFHSNGRCIRLHKREREAMGDERKTADTTRERGSAFPPSAADKLGDERQARKFLQPLAVALVCIVLVSLLLIRGLIDLTNLDKTLVDYMENRGVEIICRGGLFNAGVADH